MPIKVAKVGIKKKDGYLYFVDRDGDISMVKMSRGSKPAKKAKKPVKKARKPVKKAVKKPAKKQVKKRRK